jgi:hypothetical protein
MQIEQKQPLPQIRPSRHGPMNQRGRWNVKREAHKTIVFHFFFPKLEVTPGSFEAQQEEAAKEFARQGCEKKTIPNRQ